MTASFLASGGDASRLHLAPGERWYVATTLPRKERVAAANLANQNTRSFAPVQLETRRHARQFRTVLAPVFPGYIFVALDVARQRWRSVNGTLGVQRLVTDGERPLAVGAGIVETLIQSSGPDGALIYRGDDLATGDKVALVAGPLAGALGVLQRLDGEGRVQVLVQLLGRAVPVTARRQMMGAAL
jgi:transcription elongation factor/antiterminator RfaH